LVVGSFLPHDVKTAIHTNVSTGPAGPLHYTLNPHLLYHVISFAVPSLLILWVLKTRRQQRAAVIAMILLGVAVEVVQHARYHNHLNTSDMLYDAFGVLLAFLVRNWREPESARSASR
jgi:ABC-type Fe3+-siderophore transport system permease subunit